MTHIFHFTIRNLKEEDVNKLNALLSRFAEEAGVEIKKVQAAFNQFGKSKKDLMNKLASEAFQDLVEEMSKPIKSVKNDPDEFIYGDSTRNRFKKNPFIQSKINSKKQRWQR